MYRHGLSELWRGLLRPRREWPAAARLPSKAEVSGDDPAGPPAHFWRVHLDVAQLFQVGRKVDILVSDAAGGQAYISRIEGMGERVMAVAMPMERRLLLPLAADLPVRLRLTRGGGVYCLETRVVGYQVQPLPVVFLDKEGELLRQESRQAPRVGVFIKPLESLLAQEDGWRRLDMTILDISAGGLLFVSGELVAPGSPVRARFELPRFGQLSAISEVVRGEAGMGKANRMGARFMTLSRQDRDRLYRFVLQCQLDMRRKGLGR